MKYVEIDKLKNKFGTLLSYLYEQSGIELDNLSHKIVNNSFFDFMENNKVEEFIDMPFEEIASKLYNYKPYFDYSVDPISSIYYAGIQYINISINYRIPLRQVFLIFPLKKMVSSFDVYHEMNDKKLGEYFYSIYKKSSIFKLLIDGRFTTNELSLFSGISVGTIRSYENNEKLFSASYENISILSKILKVDESLMTKYSSFIPFDDVIYKMDEFIGLLKENITSILNINQSINYKIVYLQYGMNYRVAPENNIILMDGLLFNNLNDAKKLLENNKAVVVLDEKCILYKMQNGKMVTNVLNEKYDNLLRTLIVKFLDNNKDNTGYLL